MKVLLLTCIVSCSLAQSSKSQDQLIDSLATAAANAKNDTARLDLMYALCRQLVITGQYEKVIIKLDEMQAQVDQLSHKEVAWKKSFANRLKAETARIQNLKGVVYHRQSKFNEALESYFNALKAREELGDQKGIAMACNNIAGTYSILSNQAMQLKYLQLALKNFEEINDKTGLGQTLYNLALFHFKRGDYKQALEINMDAQNYSEDAGDKVSITHCTILTGSIYNQLNNFDQSNIYYLKALRLANQTGDKVGKGYILSNVGINYKSIGIYDSAMQAFRNALSLHQELNDNKNIADILQQIGSIYSVLKDSAAAAGDSLLFMNHVDSAFHYFEGAKSIYEQLGEKSEHTNSLLFLGQLYTDLNNYNEALTVLNKGLQMAYETNDRRDRMNAYLFISDLYSKKGDLVIALRYHKMYSSLKDSIMTESSAKTLVELNTLFESEKKEKQISLLEKQKHIDQIELALREEQIHKQELVNKDKTHQLLLFTKDKEIMNLTLDQQRRALEKQLIENGIKQKEVELLQATSELQSAKLEQVALQKRFGIAGIILLLLFWGFSYYRYKQRKKLSEQLKVSIDELKQTQNQLIETEKRREQENIRLRISRDIHDEIGSNLTKITLLSEMVTAGENGHAPELKKSISDISTYAREVNESLGEIVWAVNPGQDTLDSLLAYMRNHIHSFLQNTGIKYSIDFPAVDNDFRIDPELKRSIYLVLKESLNNAVKYSKASRIAVVFEKQHDDFMMSVRDDGIGFDISESDRFGNGLHNMPYRMEQCMCSYQIKSAPGEGCEVRISGKLYTSKTEMA